MSIESDETMSDYEIKATAIKAKHGTVILSLQCAIDELVEPSHESFFKTQDGRNLTTYEFKAAYQEAGRQYELARVEFVEKREALKYAIKHYENQIKLELAHAIIDLDGE